jgi:transposase
MSRRQELFELAKSCLASLINLVLRLEAEVLDLRRQLKELKERVAQNSRNSSKPPSADGLAKPAPKSLRKRSGRKRGGQNGHPGRTLEQVPEPDHIVVHCLDHCPCGQCGGRSLRGQPVVDYEKRQVFDLPAKLLEVTEHRGEIKECPLSGILVRAQFPGQVQAPAQYGPRFKAVQSYLNTEHFIPYDRLSRLVEDVFGQPLSEATVVSANQRIHHHLEPFEQELIERLVREALVHFDESGVRVSAKLHWLHVACTDQLTFYAIHPKRGTQAMDHFNILPRFEGWAMHDHFQPYLRYEQCVHVFCNEHHLRELKFQAEENAQAWAEDLSQFLLRQKQWRDKHGLPNERQFHKILGQYQAILSRGRQKYPRRQGRAAQSKAANLLDRLQDYDLCVLAFLLDSKVPFTNNQAEQDIRMIKTRQKISGGFRTLHGAQVFARIRSYISTCRKQGRNILQALERAFLGAPFMPAGP